MAARSRRNLAALRGYADSAKGCVSKAFIRFSEKGQGEVFGEVCEVRRRSEEKVIILLTISIGFALCLEE